MRKVVLAVVALVGVGGFIAIINYKPAAPSVSTKSAAVTPAPTTTASTVAGDSVSPDPSPGAPALKDGTYKGAVANTIYGPVQVSATMSGGKITSIIFLQTPNDRPRSLEISDQADPILISEALKAQSAQVDVVSGATQTAEGFTESLSSAIKQAQS